jgi:hypothetical protein
LTAIPAATATVLSTTAEAPAAPAVALERVEAPAAPVAEAPAAPAAEAHVAAAAEAATAAPAAQANTAAAAPAVVPAAEASAAHAQCLADFNQLNWKAAAESCALAYEQAPDATLALKTAHANFARDNVAKAGSWAAKALELGGTDADAYVLIGHAERQAGHTKTAISAYRRYLQASPQGWHARDVRAAVRTLKAKLAQATEAAPVAAEIPTP